MKKNISILGSTGSVGLTTIDLIKQKSHNFKPYLFSANKNFKLICHQIIKYKPSFFIIEDLKTFLQVKKKFNSSKVKILHGFKSFNAKKKIDITISAIPGIDGLTPTLKLIRISKKILIANKESIICGWNLILREAKKNKTRIVPIDSEHYSILSAIKGKDIEDIKKIYITASGGPFLKFTKSQLMTVKPSMAIRHPKWKMGKKISVDSSTLMNKILELIEAQKIFKLKDNKIDIVIHPECLVHAIVCFKNGLTTLVYHETSMLIPIANAIFDEKLDIKNFQKYKNKKDEIKNLNLSFKKVDSKIFPIINLKKRINEYPSTSIIINAANEVLVNQFLKKKLPFLAINKIIFSILRDKNYKKYAIRNPKNINQIYSIDKWARIVTYKLIENKHA